MWSDDVKAEAISRLSGGKSFVMSGGDLNSVIFPNNPEFPCIPVCQIEAMCEEVQKEWDIKKKHASPPKPTIEKQLEYLWKDIDNNSLNKTGTFYKMLQPYLNK